VSAYDWRRRQEGTIYCELRVAHMLCITSQESFSLSSKVVVYFLLRPTVLGGGIGTSLLVDDGGRPQGLERERERERENLPGM